MVNCKTNCCPVWTLAKGIIALMCKAMFVYDVGGIFSNLTLRSVREIERRVAIMGSSKHILIRNGNHNDTLQVLLHTSN